MLGIIKNAHFINRLFNRRAVQKQHEIKYCPDFSLFFCFKAFSAFLPTRGWPLMPANPFVESDKKVPHALSTNSAPVSSPDSAPVVPVTIHLLTDASGGTLRNVWPAVNARFIGGNFTIRLHHRPKGTRRLAEDEFERFIQIIMATGGKQVVLYTLQDKRRTRILKEALEPLGIICADPLEAAIKAVAQVSNLTPLAHDPVEPDEARRLTKLEQAMRFWHTYDDGQALAEGMARANLLLVASSRTGKTAAAGILAFRELMVANLPFVPGITNPADLKELMQANPHVQVVALTRDAGELSRFRRARSQHGIGVGDLKPHEMPAAMQARWQEAETNYFGMRAVSQEQREFAAFCRAAGVANIVDVTGCQPEEIASRILASTNLNPALG